MELTFKPKNEIAFHKAELLNKDNTKISIFPSNSYGEKSHLISISIEEITESVEGCYISMTLNKNEARYLKDILSSFINEKEIDIEAED